ncbi:PIN domain-containing protein [uncultured Tessaracoccus sp.]|uniref:PIN domain-containing protein n=1 Tax=uncultured Tessaracoccus sp. TaxID=905023 RepID=UPI00260F7D0B|nr:PIN domain-containing protein [uncultured Tessaracoccus sp.]
MIVADTNIVSEFMKGSPDQAVLRWARTLAPDEMTITVVTVEEIERGLARLPLGRRRSDLESRWLVLLDAYADGVLPYDLPAAREAARIAAARFDIGCPISLADAQIAGISVAGAAVLATRNTKDFEHIDGLRLLNPFE